MVILYVPYLEEFAPVLDNARSSAACTVSGPFKGYWVISAERELRFDRKATGLRVALWYSVLAGGFIGKITQYDHDTIRIVDESNTA